MVALQTPQPRKRPVDSLGRRSRQQKEGQAPYYHVAKGIDKIPNVHLDKATATIHWDGQNSIQKSAEHTGDKPRDSDLMVFEHVEHVVMPTGKKGEGKLFNKEDLLTALNLPIRRHLLVVALIARNDYSEGTRNVGLKRNAAFIQAMDPKGATPRATQDYTRNPRRSKRKTMKST
ncbi:hypothetical protein BGX31_002068 [Mortierella sp. GBA43]|nr:hypothetical protein BGX31_002068 [Mortierella sp. GBA43]